MLVLMELFVLLKRSRNLSSHLEHIILEVDLCMITVTYKHQMEKFFAPVIIARPDGISVYAMSLDMEKKTKQKKKLLKNTRQEKFLHLRWGCPQSVPLACIYMHTPQTTIWYIQNNLGDLITEDPFTVRLRFEPSGRAVGEVGSYYTQVKDNCCVVCGRTESYLRKNIIPREYRKYFPAVMKDHTSHDVLLLCWECHQLSNWHDLSLRTTLAKKCDAPIGTKENLKTYNIPGLKEVRSAAVALLRNGDKIPPARKEEIKKKILNYFQERGENNVELTPEMLEEASVVETCVLNQDYQPHGQKVVEFFKQDGMGGLVQLERMWREHFLETMQPKYLPPLWSVSHNHHRLAQRAEQNRVLPHELDIAGLGHITIKDSQKRCEDPSG
ncbi:exonuclease 3'-5' domain-containing protein 2 isoform X2 [Schistocerca cancellata]|uniref:exonuclease 3'-5' domain-containing protein 2 isoform X2 n=1 Tax=Schistocerca cancellata TaxID=274614 RepID=UPI0021174AFA|nr:exonuclease 3'-5' domain-containing protein 2 isoform X2 [Schistocerca cancellata]